MDQSIYLSGPEGDLAAGDRKNSSISGTRDPGIRNSEDWLSMQREVPGYGKASKVQRTARRRARAAMRAHLAEPLSPALATREVLAFLVLGSAKVPGLGAAAMSSRMNATSSRAGLLSVRHRIGGPRMPVAALPILALMSSERHRTAA